MTAAAHSPGALNKIATGAANIMVKMEIILSKTVEIRSLGRWCF
jgi:hypothetical protein